MHPSAQMSIHERCRRPFKVSPISSNFGTPQSAGYNLELLFTAGLQHRLIDPEKSRWTPTQRSLMNMLAERSYAEYNALKARPEFMDYLQTYGTLKYYGETNIASRPTRRKKVGTAHP